jgi:hypothetical protein
MDEKQFDLFQRTVQFAVDEFRANGTESGFDMGKWLSVDIDAPVKFTKVKLKDEDGDLDTWWVSKEITAGACGTAACLAGSAVLLHGGETFAAPMIWTLAGTMVRDEDTSYVVTKDNRVIHVDDRAVELLGLSNDDASRLFYLDSHSDADMNNIVQVATEIASRYGHKLEII